MAGLNFPSSGPNPTEASMDREITPNIGDYRIV